MKTFGILPYNCILGKNSEVIMASFRSRRVFARFCAPLLSNIQRCHFSQLSTQPRSVLFFGTDEFAVPSLEILASSPKVVEHIEVVCPIPTGRRHGKAVELPIRKLAEQIGLRVHDYPITPYTRSTDKFKGLDTLAANFDLGTHATNVGIACSVVTV